MKYTITVYCTHDGSLICECNADTRNEAVTILDRIRVAFNKDLYTINVSVTVTKTITITETNNKDAVSLFADLWVMGSRALSR